MLAAAAWSGWLTFRERRDELGEQARLTASSVAAYINRDISNFDHVIARIAGHPRLMTLDAPGARALLEQAGFGRRAVRRIVLVNASGTVMASTRDATRQPGSQAWAADALRTRTRVVVPVRGPGDELLDIVIGYPVLDDSRAIGALGVFVDPRSLDDVVKALPLPTTSVIAVADSRGRILSRSPVVDRFVGRYLEGRPRTTTDPLPVGVRGSVDGTRRIYGEAAVDAGPWIVSVGVPVSAAVARASVLWARSTSILALGVVGMAAIAMVLSRRLTAAMAHLDHTAQRIAAGDFSPIERRALLLREFDDLQDAFDLMLRRFNATRDALDQHLAEERRIRRELQTLQGQVIRQERLAAVGQLVSGVAHEINNPLQAILGFAELLQIQRDMPRSAKRDLEVIQRESTRACSIIRNLALFARQQPAEATTIRLGDVVAAVAELRQRRLESEDIELAVEDQATQSVLAPLAELQQVLLNFVINAEQAIIASGRLPAHILVRTFDVGEHVMLEVEDSGPGVPAEHEAKLFEPFFTTKPVGQGTGLGLSVSYGIIDSMRGQIGHRRYPAGGAIFFFSLPAVKFGT